MKAKRNGGGGKRDGVQDLINVRRTEKWSLNWGKK